MSKKFLKTLGITLSLTMFLFALVLATPDGEDPPLMGENINVEYHIC